jgi:AcrR family transcriptional regulator
VEGAREEEILRATLHVLAETGYDRLTFDLVAARAHTSKATLYRRWSTKPELVAEAVVLVAPTDLPLPDTGSMRGDLLALARTRGFFDPEQARLACGLATALHRDPELHDIVREKLLEAGTAHLRAVLARAVERGQLNADVDVELMCRVVPAMALFHLLFETGEKYPPDYAGTVIDRIVLPVLDPFIHRN